MFLLFRLTKAALPQFVVVNGFIFATTTKDVICSKSRYEINFPKRRRFNDLFSLTFLFFLCLYIYIYVCKKKRFKNETSSLSFSATSGLKRRQQPLFDARECAVVTKQMWRKFDDVATEKIWFFGCLGYEI